MKSGNRKLLIATGVAVTSLGLCMPSALASDASSPSLSSRSDTMVGTGVADITPAKPVFLGGYGFGGWRLSTGVLNPLKVHVIAVRSHKETLLIGSIDSQGYFSAYQDGPFGLDDVRATVSSQTGIPVANMIFSSLHSHAAPDTVGIWGGVPDWYLKQVHDACVQAALQAVESLEPARIYTGQVETEGLSTSFTSDNTQWPRDQALRVLVAKTPGGQVIASMVNYGVHPTVLPRTNSEITPDWPAIAENDLTKATNGAFSMVLIGDLGRTWPAFPADVQAPSDPYAQMDLYGSLVASEALKAIDSAKPLPNSEIGAVQIPISEKITTGAMLPLYQGGMIDRSKDPNYFNGSSIYSSVTEFRIGPDVLYGMPVEPYPDLVFQLEQKVNAPLSFVAGLANDQLGYAAPASAYPGIVANSPDDEAEFVINPKFGDDIVSSLSDAARQLGFKTTRN